MLSLTGGIRVFVCTQPADMRRSFDGLCGMVENIVQQDPLSGFLFVFRNRNRDRLKILFWDTDGFVIWYKRLEEGAWQLPTDMTTQSDGEVSAEISTEELSLLLGGVDLRSVERRRRYQRSKKTR
jgi:transposase